MKFMVGDRVKLLRKVRTRARGWRNSWVSGMDDAVGKIGTVTYVDDLPHDVMVRFSGLDVDYGYPDFALKLMPKVKRKKK